MYNTNDKKAAILEIQSFLREIYEADDLYKSGVYDKETRDLIIRFQSENEIDPSGTVNLETNKKLYNSYKKNRQKNRIRNKGIDLPLSEGDTGDDVRRLNRDVGSILDKYGIHHNLRSHPYFNSATAEGIKELCRIMNLQEKTEIDEELYTRIDLDLK